MAELPFTEKELAAAKFRMLLAVALDGSLSRLAIRAASVIACMRINFKTGGFARCAIATYCNDLGIKSDSAMRAALSELETRDYFKAEKSSGKVTRYLVADRFFVDGEPRLVSWRGDEQTPPDFEADTPPQDEAGTPPQFTADTPPHFTATNNGKGIPEKESRKENSGKGERVAPQSASLFPEADATERELSRGKLPARVGATPPPGFDEFWAVYPRPVGKPYAQKAFMRAVRTGASPAEIIAGAARFAAERAAQEPHLAQRERFTPYPATWLNREGWADQPAVAPSTHRAFDRRHDAENFTLRVAAAEHAKGARGLLADPAYDAAARILDEK